jgi:hypothetical protein
MLLHHAPVSQPADAKMHCIGVGIDTSRYGHCAAFLRDDLQPAAGELQNNVLAIDWHIQTMLHAAAGAKLPLHIFDISHMMNP